MTDLQDKVLGDFAGVIKKMSENSDMDELTCNKCGRVKTFTITDLNGKKSIICYWCDEDKNEV